MRLEEFLNKLRENEFAAAGDDASVAGPPVRQEPRPYYPYFDPIPPVEPIDPPEDEDEGEEEPFDPNEWPGGPEDWEPGDPVETLPPDSPYTPGVYPCPPYNVDTDGDGIPDGWYVPPMPPPNSIPGPDGQFWPPPNQQWNFDPNAPWRFGEPAMIPLPGFDQWGNPLDEDGNVIPIDVHGQPLFDPFLFQRWWEKYIQPSLEDGITNWWEFFRDIDWSNPMSWPWQPWNWEAPPPGEINPIFNPFDTRPRFISPSGIPYV